MSNRYRKNEPYWATYVKSWRKPRDYKDERTIVVPELKHCDACTRTCHRFSEYEKRACLFYNCQ